MCKNVPDVSINWTTSAQLWHITVCLQEEDLLIGHVCLTAITGTYTQVPYGTVQATVTFL